MQKYLIYKNKFTKQTIKLLLNLGSNMKGEHETYHEEREFLNFSGSGGYDASINSPTSGIVETNNRDKERKKYKK
jgi:hypothetical protein